MRSDWDSQAAALEAALHDYDQRVLVCRLCEANIDRPEHADWCARRAKAIGAFDPERCQLLPDPCRPACRSNPWCKGVIAAVARDRGKPEPDWTHDRHRPVGAS